MTLAQLGEKEKAIIRKIGDLGELKRRLMELGVLCGEPVQMVRKAPFGDPLEIRVADTDLAIRREEADKIDVEPISPSKRHKEDRRLR